MVFDISDLTAALSRFGHHQRLMLVTHRTIHLDNVQPLGSSLMPSARAVDTAMCEDSAEPAAGRTAAPADAQRIVDET